VHLGAILRLEELPDALRRQESQIGRNFRLIGCSQAPAKCRGLENLPNSPTTSEKDGGNARLLKDLPVRLYTERDVVWTIEHIGRDYYTLNAMDQAALVLQLRTLGDTSAELITTTGKGYRPPGTRNPHSWTIVDEPALAEWIARVLHL
jgi:hypothetical protein